MVFPIYCSFVGPYSTLCEFNVREVRNTVQYNAVQYNTTTNIQSWIKTQTTKIAIKAKKKKIIINNFMAVVLYCSGLHHTGVSMLLITQGIVMSPSTSQTVSSKTYWTLNPHFYHAINWSLVPVSIQKSSNLFAEKQALFSRHQKTCENLWCSCPQTTR